MDMTVAKWGNSLGLRIPGALAKAIGLSEGSSVKLATQRGKLVIEPTKPAGKKANLAALLAKVTPDNLHASVETGKPVGQEIW